MSENRSTWVYTYHRWPDEQAWRDALLIAQTDPVTLQGMATDEVGVIHKETGETRIGEHGGPEAVVAPLPGFHVNVARMQGVPLPDGWSATEIFPDTPHRVFA
jgi:hypothetical protein